MPGLYTIFSIAPSVESKKQKLSSVYGIEMTRELESEVLEMCNLSSRIADINKAIGREEGIGIGRMQTLIQLVLDGDLTVVATPICP